ncbi:hypothetical protein [Burkholderia cepacia]|uniref:hypothetical protein n=1 Tax=Burkholderia cepacia TaxID=292 RepID=UPI0012D49FDF|nr:hypothetical protein [Burkholderia cepacia]
MYDAARVTRHDLPADIAVQLGECPIVSGSAAERFDTVFDMPGTKPRPATP